MSLPPDIFNNKTCLMIGNGQSSRRIDLEGLREKYDFYLTVNRALPWGRDEAKHIHLAGEPQYGTDPDFSQWGELFDAWWEPFFFLDKSIYARKETIMMRDEKVFPFERVPRHRIIEPYFVPWEEWTGKLIVDNCSISTALHLCFILKFSAVHLVGCELLSATPWDGVFMPRTWKPKDPEHLALSPQRNEPEARKIWEQMQRQMTYDVKPHQFYCDFLLSHGVDVRDYSHGALSLPPL